MATQKELLHRYDSIITLYPIRIVHVTLFYVLNNSLICETILYIHFNDFGSALLRLSSVNRGHMNKCCFSNGACICLIDVVIAGKPKLYVRLYSIKFLL